MADGVKNYGLIFDLGCTEKRVTGAEIRNTNNGQENDRQTDQLNLDTQLNTKQTAVALDLLMVFFLLSEGQRTTLWKSQWILSSMKSSMQET